MAHYSQTISGMVTINRLYTFTNVVSNASISFPPLPQQTGVLKPNSGQTAADSDTITIDSLQLLAYSNAVSNGKIADSLQSPVLSK